MKPYYEHAGITIYHADMRELLPQLERCESLITDPVWPNCPAGLLPGSENPWELFEQFWRTFGGLGEPNMPTRCTFVMRHDSDPRILNPVSLPYARATILPYVMPGYIGRYLGGDEIGYSFGEPIPSR